MRSKRMGRSILVVLLTIAMLLSVTAAAEVADTAEVSFAEQLESNYVDPDLYYQSDVRWWLGDASLTDAGGDPGHV